MNPQSMFGQNLKKTHTHNFSSENYHFYRREILLYIPLACFRNVSSCVKSHERS